MHEAVILCLGDSYTVGEGVPEQESFPFQLVRRLSAELGPLPAPRVLARTGWTTDELLEAMAGNGLIPPRPIPGLRLVTLLVGVNNQYRGRDVVDFALQFDTLLITSARLLGGKSGRVMVISIPDWGATPFASGKDASRIAGQIDQFNAACGRVARLRGARFIDVTAISRSAGGDDSFLANDGLHPSGRQYGLWVEQMLPAAQSTLRQGVSEDEPDLPLRFVVLRHEQAASAHFDLMVEHEPGGRLRSWRVRHWPTRSDDTLEPAPDHRRDYLELEGELSGGRGSVHRVCEGTADRVQGGIELRTTGGELWRVPIPD
jgi:lysophospholipase L1-like esterase